MRDYVIDPLLYNVFNYGPINRETLRHVWLAVKGRAPLVDVILGRVDRMLRDFFFEKAEMRAPLSADHEIIIPVRLHESLQHSVLPGLMVIDEFYKIFLVKVLKLVLKFF